MRLLSDTARRRRVCASLYGAALLSALIVLQSCDSLEQTVDGDLPYVEQLVVSGLLTVGEPVTDIVVTRTLPPLETYELLKALVPDAVVTIETDTDIYTLRYVGLGTFEARELIVQSGMDYRLTIEWRNKRVFGNARAPFPAQPDSMWFTQEIVEYEYWTSEERFIAILLQPSAANIYAASVLDESSVFNDTTMRFWNVFRTEDAVDGQLVVKTEENFVLWDIAPATLTVRVHSFNDELYPYFATRNNRDVTEVFSTSGLDVQWAVTGDGIGYFGCVATSWTSIEFDPSVFE